MTNDVPEKEKGFAILAKDIQYNNSLCIFMSLEKVQKTKRLTLEDIAPLWAKFLSEGGQTYHPPSVPMKMSD